MAMHSGGSLENSLTVRVETWETNHELPNPSNLAEQTDSVTLAKGISTITGETPPLWQFSGDGHLTPGAAERVMNIACDDPGLPANLAQTGCSTYWEVANMAVLGWDCTVG